MAFTLRIGATGWACLAGRPPFGTFSAYDLNTGERLYETPFGRSQLQGFIGLASWGSPTLGGPVVTGRRRCVPGRIDGFSRSCLLMCGPGANCGRIWSMLQPYPYQQCFTHGGVDYVVFAVGGNSYLEAPSV